MTVTLEISAQVLLHNSLSNGKKFPIRGVSARLFNDRSMMIAYINITVSHSRYLLSPALSLREVSVDKRRQAPVDSKQIKIRFPVKKNKYLQISTVLESHLLYLVVLIAAQAPLEFLSIEGPRYSIRQPFPLDVSAFYFLPFQRSSTCSQR